MATATDPRAEAEAYLKEHNVKELFRDLGARLMFARPADPNAFLLETLEQMQEDRAATFFTAEDISAAYAALDPNNTGTVTAQQYAHALKSVGVDAPRFPLEEGVATLDKKTFEDLLARELKPPEA